MFYGGGADNAIEDDVGAGIELSSSFYEDVMVSNVAEADKAVLYSSRRGLRLTRPTTWETCPRGVERSSAPPGLFASYVSSERLFRAMRRTSCQMGI